MQVLFLICLILTAFPYVVFPAAMWLANRVRSISWRQKEHLPRVTLIVSVYNEERVIAQKIENSLALDYPHEKLEILVVSDGSTDRTHDIVEDFDDARIRLMVVPGRVGKTACLNRSVPDASGDIIVFTDANSMFSPETLRMISRNFADDAIGLVTGWTRYRTAKGGEESTGLYARLEKITKQGESAVSSCVGADGAVFAIRKQLYRPLRDDDINDFVIPLNVVGQGRRVVLDPCVFCYEEPSNNENKEYRRQVRITNRTLGAIWRGRTFLNPVRYGSFSIFLFCHKVLRFLVPLFFVMTWGLGFVLVSASPFHAFIFIGQTLFIALGALGLFRRLDNRAVNLCSFFLLTITAQGAGWLRFISGKRDTVWTPQR